MSNINIKLKYVGFPFYFMQHEKWVFNKHPIVPRWAGNLFEFFLLRRNYEKKPGEPRERLTVVGATSGDTGRLELVLAKKDINSNYALLVPPSTVYGTRLIYLYSYFTPKDEYPLFRRHK